MSSPFPELPPEIAERVKAVKAGSAGARKVVGKAATGIQQVVSVRRPERQAFAKLDVDEVSPAEHRVLLHICEGRSTEEIACLVFISQETVKSHVRQMLHRCGCRNRAQLAYRWGRGELAVVSVSHFTRTVLVEKTAGT